MRERHIELCVALTLVACSASDLEELGPSAADSGALDVGADSRPTRVPPVQFVDAGAPAPDLPYEPLSKTRCERDSDTLSYVESARALGVDFEAAWVASDAGEKRDHHVGGGAAVVDVTGDDWPDLIFTAAYGSPALFVADGRGAFARREAAGFENLEHTLSAYALDLDRDGLRDLVFTTWHGVYAYRNIGGGSFVPSTELYSASVGERPTFLAFTDFDGDAEVDVFIGMGPTCFRDDEAAVCGAADRLLRGRGDFDFEDVSERLGAAADRMGLAVAGGWMDLDRDGDLDLLVGNDAGSYIVPNRVFLNPGLGEEGPFVESSEALGLDAGMAAMGVAFGDADLDDGRILAVTDLRSIRLFATPPGSTEFTEEHLVPSFSTVPLTPGFAPAAWAVELEDLDHDGHRDLVSTWSWLFPEWWWEYSRLEEELEAQLTPHVPTLWLRREGAFVERSEVLADAPRSWTWRGVLPVDLDRDGTLDLVFTSMMGPVGILMADCNSNDWLEVQLRQPGSGNPDALGALVEVNAGLDRQWRRIGLGSTGASSGREPVAHFGLGSRSRSVVRITWPDGETLDLGAVDSRQRIRVTRQ